MAGTRRDPFSLVKQDSGSDVREMQSLATGKGTSWQPLYLYPLSGVRGTRDGIGTTLSRGDAEPTCSGGGILMRKVLPETLKGLCSDGQFTKERYEAHSQARVCSWLRDNWNRSHGLNSCLQTGPLSCLAFHVSKA